MPRAEIESRLFPTGPLAVVSPALVSDAQRAFARNLRDTRLPQAAHRPEHQALLGAFRPDSADRGRSAHAPPVDQPKGF